MSGEDAAPSTLESAEKPRRITMALIAESSDSSLEPEERAQHVVGLRRLRLGHLNLGSMEGLDPCNAATHIYLQHNRVREIEGLDFFHALQFLVLSHNRLEWVSGVAHLPSLLHLDLSHNSIDDVAEPNNLFPQSLIHLDLRANPCSARPSYRESLLGALTQLRRLDDQPTESSDEETDSSSSDETEAPRAMLTEVPRMAPGESAEDVYERLVERRWGGSAGGTAGVKDKVAQLRELSRCRRQAEASQV